MNTVSVLAGKYKGQKLQVPASAHPLGSREKNALFNMLVPYLDGANVLDAFAGTGALGLEALSRGARSATFIESHPGAVKILRENIKDCKIFNTRVANFDSDETFDLIFADPPYDHIDPTELNHLTKFLKPSALLALSHPKGSTFSLKGCEIIRQNSYARCTLTLYKKSTPSAQTVV